AAVAAVLSGRGHTVIPVKPVQTGEPEGSGDVVSVEKLTGLPGVELARYPEPLAPNIAARRAGMPQVERAELGARIRELDGPDRIVLVEGAGGLLVRLADDLTIGDIAADLGAPLLVVTSLGLGSLNTAELTVRAAQARGLRVLGLIGGSLPAEPDLATRENLAELPRVTGVRLLGCLPAGRWTSGTCLEEFEELLRQLTVGVDPDVRLTRVIAGAHTPALPHRVEPDLLQDAGRGRVVGGDAGRDRGVRVDAPHRLERGLRDLGGEAVAPLVGAETVLEVPDAAVDELDAADADELGRLVAHVDAPRAEIFRRPGRLGAADELVGLLDRFVARVRAVLPDALVAVDLVGLGVVTRAQGHEDESFGSRYRSHAAMLHRSHFGVKAFPWAIFLDCQT
ncbi:MAG TPA: dethiobiotin synthase, partial [Corynebacterium sp.]|nr:dethiobiotin synthase [Corynebacterium sp.]